MPFPEKFSNFIENQLAPGLTPSNQFVIHDGVTGMTSQMHDIVTHFAAYEDASVKYSDDARGLGDTARSDESRRQAGLHRCARDHYKMPSPRPFFSTTSTSCTVTSTSDNAANVNCPSGGTTLIRTELSMAGWKAYVNGKAATIKT